MDRSSTNLKIKYRRSGKLEQQPSNHMDHIRERPSVSSMDKSALLKAEVKTKYHSVGEGLIQGKHQKLDKMDCTGDEERLSCMEELPDLKDVIRPFGEFWNDLFSHDEILSHAFPDRKTAQTPINGSSREFACISPTSSVVTSDYWSTPGKHQTRDDSSVEDTPKACLPRQEPDLSLPNHFNELRVKSMSRNERRAPKKFFLNRIRIESMF
mmetsp:Transcript_28062/g.43196  ORF Transcript_28062/g.43196 Transcript_28062/m.43196 type:complete len:211 (-) Transcript_28062:1094-1726(-)